MSLPAAWNWKTPGEPEVFVIAGCGAGTPIFRRLQREGVPFAAGVLWENDLDYPAARALAAELVSEKPYQSFSEEKISQAKKLIDGCRQVICAPGLEMEGSLAEGLRVLARYGQEQGKL